jgi:putative membrane protein
LLSAVVIWIVSQLGLGLAVKNFGSAFAAAAIIAIVSALVGALLGLLGLNVSGGILGAIVHLIIAAIVLLISDRILPGMEVGGFFGALVAVIGIAVVGWFVQWLLSLLGLL